MIKEACVETFEEAILAEKSGASRIELCSNLHLDGLTPSEELIRRTTETLKIPVMVMIRPRGGNFVFSSDELGTMKSEIDIAKKFRIHGIVIGLLTSKNKIDLINTEILAHYAGNLEVTFHKAIDLLEDPAEGIRELKKIRGITRVLTSGGKPTALEGAEKIREMISIAGERPIIIVAGKIMKSNVDEISRLTGAAELHGRRIVGSLSE
jgi:copper homeostasis protein